MPEKVQCSTYSQRPFKILICDDSGKNINWQRFFYDLSGEWFFITNPYSVFDADNATPDGCEEVIRKFIITSSVVYSGAVRKKHLPCRESAGAAFLSWNRVTAM